MRHLGKYAFDSPTDAVGTCRGGREQLQRCGRGASRCGVDNFAHYGRSLGFIEGLLKVRVQARRVKKSFLFGHLFFNITNVFCARQKTGGACAYICPARMVTG